MAIQKVQKGYGRSKSTGSANRLLTGTAAVSGRYSSARPYPARIQSVRVSQAADANRTTSHSGIQTAAQSGSKPASLYKGAAVGAGRVVSTAAESGAQRSSDKDRQMSGEMVRTAIATSAGAVRSFRLSQSVSNTTLKTASITGDVIVTAYRAGICTVSAARFAHKRFIPYTSQITKNIWMRRAKDVGLFDTRTARVLTGAERLPRLNTKLPHGAAARAMGVGGSVLTKSDDYMVHGIGKGMEIASGVDRGLKTTVRGIQTTAKAVRHTGRAIRTVGSTALRSGKRIFQATKWSVKYIADHGWRDFAKHARNQIWKTAKMSVRMAGKAITQFFSDLARNAVKKLVLPLILLIGGVVVALNVLATPIMSVGSLVSGVFNIVGTDGNVLSEVNVDDFLNDQMRGVPKLREEAVTGLIADLSSSLKENGGSYDIARIKVTPTGEPSVGTEENVHIKFHPAPVISEMIKPVFNALVVSSFDMAVTEEQGFALVEELFSEIYAVNYVSTTEYCGQDLENGTGAAVTPHSECGEIHALADCPNIETGYHDYFACAGCCKQVCAGHKGYLDCSHTTEPHSPWSSAENPGCYTTIHHSGTAAASCGQPLTGVECSGYSYCGGHSVYTAVLDMKQLNELIYKYFTEPIAQLESIEDRTPELDKKLSDLQLGAALCEVFMQEAPVFYGAEGFMNPVRYTDISSYFGWRLHPIYGDWRHHNGLDMSAPAGTPIYASKDGVVTSASYNSSAGNNVVLEHDEGYTTIYMHMTYSIVQAGQTVSQGQVIGYVGSTGDSTGAHLHFEILKDGSYVDPEQYIDLTWMPGDTPKNEVEPTEAEE